MRWFKHLVNLRRDPKIRKIRKKLGELGYGRAVSLMEIVGERGGAATKAFNPKIDLRNPLTDLEWLAEEWEITPEEAQKTLDQLAQIGFIDTKTWGKKVIYLPEMKKLLDEWTSRLQRERYSGATPELLGRNSSKSESKRKNKITELKREKENRLDTEGGLHPEIDPQFEKKDCPWGFLGINRNIIPNKYLNGNEPGSDGIFEPFLRNLYKNETSKSRALNIRLEPIEFAEIVLSSCQNLKIAYPRALLMRKKELEEFS